MFGLDIKLKDKFRIDVNLLKEAVLKICIVKIYMQILLTLSRLTDIIITTGGEMPW